MRWGSRCRWHRRSAGICYGHQNRSEIAHQVSPDTTRGRFAPLALVRVEVAAQVRGPVQAPRRPQLLPEARAGLDAMCSGAGGGGSAALVFDDHPGLSAACAYNTKLRSSCSTSRTSFLPLLSVCHTPAYQGIEHDVAVGVYFPRAPRSAQLVPVAQTA